MAGPAARLPVTLGRGCAAAEALSVLHFLLFPPDRFQLFADTVFREEKVHEISAQKTATPGSLGRGDSGAGRSMHGPAAHC